MSTKTCFRCKQVKAHSEFHTNRKTADGKTYYCKACTRKATAKPKVEKVCELCGKPFMTAWAKWRFCDDCRANHRKEMQRRAQQMRPPKRKVCQVCGKEYYTPARDNNIERVWCSQKCRMELLPWKACAYCGERYKTIRPASIYCRKKCDGAAKRWGTKEQKARILAEREAAARERGVATAERKRGARQQSTAAKKQERLRHNRKLTAEAIRAWRKYGGIKAAAIATGVKVNTIQHRCRNSKVYQRQTSARLAKSSHCRKLRQANTMSRKYTNEGAFVADLTKIMEERGLTCEVERKIWVFGSVARRADIVISQSGEERYVIEAKAVNRTAMAAQCLGQALLDAAWTKLTPLCAFPSDAMPDRSFIDAARTLGVGVVSEQTITGEICPPL